MNLLPTEDELQIAETVGDLLERVLPKDLIRQRVDENDAVAAEQWSTCMETGILALGIDEDHGGVGLGLAEEALAFREIGRHVAPGPFLSSLLGARVAALSGAGELFDRIVSGQEQVGLVVLRPGASLTSGVLDGDVFLLDGTAADHFLALGDDGAAVFARGEFAGIDVVRSLDPGTRLERAHADGIPPVAQLGGAAIRSRALVLGAALLAGIAEASRDASTLHAKTREQFGRPIGINQAIKHRCADMAVQAEAATSQVLYAAAAVDSGHEDAAFHASIAHLIAAHAAIENAENTVQVHGGMGYTWEHDSHLYVKRARVWGQALSLTAGDRERLLDTVIA